MKFWRMYLRRLALILWPFTIIGTALIIVEFFVWAFADDYAFQWMSKAWNNND